MFWRKKQDGYQLQLPSKKVKLCGCDFRDGQQSLYATRFRTEDILPVLPKMDCLGFESMEVWGGATFDTCIRYLNEDPWERLRAIKSHLKNTPVCMLLRGQNLLAYRQFPDDVVRKFVELAAKNGMDIFGVFDGLNDVRNCDVAIDAIKKAGKHCRASIVYTVSPIHTMEKLVETARAYEAAGADSVTLVDMAGQMTPSEAYKNVRALKSALKIPVAVNCHATGGMATAAYLEAVRAWADILSTCSAPLSGGTSLPSTEAVTAMLQDTPAATGLDLSVMVEIQDALEKVCDKYQEYLSKFTGVNIQVLKHQTPGGMISNMESQLKMMNVISRIDEVFEEIPKVRKDLGYPPLVTPFSQMVGAQATTNVITGNRYQLLSKEVRNYVKGAYGQAPGEISEELKKKALGDGEQIMTVRPGSLLEDEWENAKKETSFFARCEEDVMTWLLFPETATEFFNKRK